MFELQSFLPVIIGLLFAGALAGTLAGLLGVGGGIINVPVLYFLFQSFGVPLGDAMVIATGTSLATILPTSVSSIRSHHLRGNIDWPLLKRWFPFMVIGVVMGSVLVTVLDGRYFTFVFASIALLMAYNLYYRSEHAALLSNLPGLIWQALLAWIIGFFSVMAGIGGGTLGVSILTACNHAMHRAVGTSAAFGFLIALPGVIVLLLLAQTPESAPPLTWGYINLLSLFILIPMSVLFAPVGVALGARLEATKLKKIFAFLLVLTALRMFWSLVNGN